LLEAWATRFQIWVESQFRKTDFQTDPEGKEDQMVQGIANSIDGAGDNPGSAEREFDCVRRRHQYY